MKREISPPVAAVCLIVVFALVLGGIWYFAYPHAPTGVKYTPGVPPWMEKGAAPYRAASNYETAASAAAKQRGAQQSAASEAGK